LIGCHVVMERPDSVSRVTPPGEKGEAERRGGKGIWGDQRCYQVEGVSERDVKRGRGKRQGKKHVT
jgi:hypothetical protein